jgi:Mg2+ and Co2+ transporter CorA
MNKDTEQVSQGTEQKRQGREQTSQGGDLTDIKIAIARIEENIKSIKDDVGEIKTSTDGLTKELGITGNRVTAVEGKISIFAIFGSIFTILTGAIATYLGTK